MFMKFLVGLGTSNNELHFGSDVHSYIEYYFFFAYLHYVKLRYFTIVHYMCQHYNADDFSDEPNFNIVYQFNIAN